jgi:hypothetical protein
MIWNLPPRARNLAAELGDDARHQIGIFLVLDRIVDLGTRDPIGWHLQVSIADKSSRKSASALLRR